MKILSVGNTADLYGGARCIERVFGRFAQDGHEVHVVLPQDGPIVKLLEQRGVHVHIYPELSIIDRAYLGSINKSLRFAFFFPVSIIRLSALILRHGIQVVHTNVVVLPASGVAAWLTNRPHVWHIRELLSEFGRLWKPYQRYINLFSDAIIAISECVRDQFDPAIRGRVEVIYDGLDQTAVDVSSSRKMVFRNSLPPNQLLIGVVGRIKFHRKGQEVLVEAAALLKDVYPEAHYVVVGSPSPGSESHAGRLRQLIADHGLSDQFTMLGETDDPMSLFAALDIAVVPSVQAEPFGVVVIEAMSAGTPVVGSRCGGIAEQIVHGESGLLFEPGDAASLAQAIGKLLDDADLRNRMSENGLLRVRQKFPFEGTYLSMASIFERVTGATIKAGEEDVRR